MRTFRAKFKTLPGQALYQGVVKVRKSFLNNWSLQFLKFPDVRKQNSIPNVCQLSPFEFIRKASTMHSGTVHEKLLRLLLDERMRCVFCKQCTFISSYLVNS